MAAINELFLEAARFVFRKKFANDCTYFDQQTILMEFSFQYPNRKYISKALPRFMRHLSLFPNLHTLRCKYGEFTDSDLDYVCTTTNYQLVDIVSQFKSLKTLKIGSNGLLDEHLYTMALSLENIEIVEIVDLHSNRETLLSFTAE
ncbi:hypothetical protein Bhyg_01478, partial [Pseudolycoriella hygida]